MNRRNYYKRVRGLFRPHALRGKWALVHGLGSGGSREAAEFGRLGLNLLLADLPGEKLEEHNILRHELGYRSLGKPKTTELAAHIHNLNPDIEIVTTECDVVTQPDSFEAVLDRRPVDIVLSCTDSAPSRQAINALCVARSLPMVGAAVYDGGVGGEVYRMSPGKACYACISAVIGDGQARTARRRRINYENPNQRELRSTSALNLDITQIAILQARVALQVLLGPEAPITGLPPEVNVIRFANRGHPDVLPRPYHAEFFVVERRPDCLVCGAKPDNLSPEDHDILAGLV